jgi:1,4-dihydroxy-2-naphthoate octaprenyltransferase
MNSLGSSSLRTQRTDSLSGIGRKLSAWAQLSRLPFHSVGILPFILGAVLAWKQAGVFRWDVFGWGTAGLVLVMLATCYAGEYWDSAEDALSALAGTTRFSGGSQVVQRGLLPRHAPLWASLVSLLLAIVVAVVLQCGYRTGLWTIPFAMVGLLGGFFYSARPVRWVSSGLGELWIAFNYGWLPVAVGAYLQVGEVPPLAHWLAVPIGLTIFNVILLNEFPDYAADREAGKTNLTVRLGRERAAVFYCAVATTAVAALLLSWGRGLPWPAIWFALPAAVLSAVLVVAVLRGRWRDRATLETLCGANLLVNLGTTAAYILALVFWS